MNVEVDFRGLRDISDALLRRVEDGETIVVTRGGKPVADLVPHQAETRWMTPADVMAIGKLASADPTWAADLSRLRAESTEDFDSI